jgi:cell pole-organizing protein PopZ
MSETEQEPSMEEILASIRRIISDDDDQSKTEETQNDPDPAEPDEPIEDQETNQALSPTDAVDPVAELEVDDDDDDDEVLDLTDMDVADPEPLFEQQAYQVPVPPVAAPEPPPPPSPAPQHNQDKLVSTSQASETIDEFTKLGNKLYEDVKELPIGNGAVTLEELTRELVRPMLKEWLDQHLPITVERLVREEIERLVMQSQRKDPW